MSKTFDHAPADSTDDTRRIWVRPSYQRMRAGDAEVGPNPNAPDGGFTGS